MAARTQHDTHKVAEDHEARLQAWIDTTPIEEVPVNQFKEATRSRICKLLNISPSSVHSNPRVAKMFSDLDSKVRESIATNGPNIFQVSRKSRELQFIADLRARTENAELRCARLQYLEDTGHLLREEK